MFKKILVALDHSPEADSVFDFALSLAQPEVSEVLLVNFVDWQINNISPWVGLGTLYDVDLSGERRRLTSKYLRKEVEFRTNWLELYNQKANKLNFSCKFDCLVGGCYIGIGDRAKQCGADLIVIGRRGRKNISEILLGSVSNYVIHHAPCSVLVVQGNEVSSEVENLAIPEKISVQ